MYLILPLFYVVTQAGLKAFLGYLMIAIFLISYRELYCCRSQKVFTFWLIVEMAIVVIYSMWYDPNILFMGFFPANFIGWYKNKKHFQIAIISFAVTMIVCFVIIAFRFQIMNSLYFLPFLVVMIASPYGIRNMNERMELKKQLNQANEQIKELIKREERTRIARDLHDTLGHTLSLITLKSQVVQRLAEKDSKRVIKEAKEIEATSRSALREVRELISDMRTVTVENELVDMEQILIAAGIVLHVERHIEANHLTLLQQNIIGMCIREAGTNIVKHSHANHCYIDFQNNRGNFILTIRDDGVGMESSSQKGNGLIGMRERLSLIEGRLDISFDGGTILVITVPVIIKMEEGVAL